MKQIFFFILSLFLPFASSAQVITTTLEHPEAIVSDGNFLFVSCFGKDLAPAQKDTDGYIAKINFDGSVVEKHFFTGLSAPKGMCIVGDVLYFTDINRVKGVNLSNKTIVLDVKISAAKFLNDITSQDGKKLLISDSSLKAIFEVELQEANYSVYDSISAPTSTNGLHYDKKTKRLYVAGGKRQGEHASIGYYDANKKFVQISTTAGSFDGLFLLNENTLLATDWQNSSDNGRLVKINISTGSVSPCNNTRIAGSADFYYHAPTKMVFIPALVSSKIYKFMVK